MLKVSLFSFIILPCFCPQTATYPDPAEGSWWSDHLAPAGEACASFPLSMEPIAGVGSVSLHQAAIAGPLLLAPS